jgi:hypothetical protein
MANEIRSRGNPFIAAAERVRKGDAPGTAIQVSRTRNMPRAALNLIPGHDELSTAIDRALQAVSRGVRWARGSILNLLV